MSKKGVIVLVIIFVLIGIAVYVFSPFIISGRNSANSVNVPEVKISYSNFEEQLIRQSLVQDIPENGVMVLRFYNYNSGAQEWENSYILRKGDVQKGTLEDADIIISMHSKYLNTLTNKNLCATIITAKASGDVAVETGISQTSLGWRYRSMLKYKECLGI